MQNAQHAPSLSFTVTIVLCPYCTMGTVRDQTSSIPRFPHDEGDGVDSRIILHYPFY